MIEHARKPVEGYLGQCVSFSLRSTDRQKMRSCRTRPGTQYLASVAVIWTELIKLLICVGAQGAECARTASQRGLGFREEAMHQTYEILGRSWPMLVPAALFVMQQVQKLPL